MREALAGPGQLADEQQRIDDGGDGTRVVGQRACRVERVPGRRAQATVGVR